MTKQNYALASIESIETEYNKLLPVMTRMCEAMRLRIDEAVKSASFQLAFPVEARVKNFESVVRKVRSADIENITRLGRIDDLIGLRLVVFFGRDLQAACNLLNAIGNVRKQKMVTPKQAQFGYLSMHCVIEPSAELLAESDGQTGLVAEVQVRTLAQHCWAAASHRLHYKSDDSVAESIKRPLDRVAALIEIVDSEFERLLKIRDDYRETMAYEADDAFLNVDNLEAMLRMAFPDQQEWFEHFSISHVLEDLAFFGVTTRGKLKNLLGAEPVLMTPASAYPEDFDGDVPDESPDTMILGFLCTEYPERFSEYQLVRAREAFKDIDISEWTADVKPIPAE